MTAQPQQNPKDSWISRHPIVVIGIILLATLGPFVNKAIQRDDALFVWTGQWIQGHPLDFYGGKADWWSSTIPMWMANQNPPLLPYFFAGAGAIFGWNEIPLHIVTMGFAFAAAAGIYSLAKMWCGRPLLATVIAIFTPAFLVSSATLMCDVPMLSFWIWSIVAFERAIEANSKSPWPFGVAGFLAGLAILTKYSAMMLLPLLGAMGVLRLRRLGWWVIALIVPVIFIASYELLTAKLYGHGLIFAAGRYAQSTRFGFPGGAIAKGIIALTFAGGSFLPVLFLAPWLWRWRTWVVGGIVILGTLIVVFSVYNPGLIHSWEDPEAWNKAGFRLEVALFVTAGAQLILIAAADAMQRRDSVSVTLFIWIIGVFIFAGVVNWTSNVRSFLPACPAAAILAVRRLEMVKGRLKLPVSLGAPISFAAFLALSLVFADYQTANTTRAIAKQIAKKYSAQGCQVWIEGHWGFQYYMQNFGGKPVDIETSWLEPGDIVAVSWDSGINAVLPPGSVGVVDAFAPDTKSWMNLSGQNQYGMAGFYASDFGPVPFVIGEHGPSFFVAKALSQVRYQTRPENEQQVAQNGAVPEFSRPDCTVESGPPPENPAGKKQLELAVSFEQAGNVKDAVQSYRKSLEADPDNAEALNNLAWVLTTASDPAERDAPEALQLAAKAVGLTQSRDPVMIGTLAAALAENGDFPKAIGTARFAAQLALLTGRNDVATINAKLMELYARGKTASNE